MNRRVALISVAMLGGFVAGPAIAQQSLTALPTGEGRACTPQDVAGLWESLVLTTTEAGTAEHYAKFPRDYMRFGPDGRFMYFGSQQRLADAAAISAKLDDYDRRDGVTYRSEVGPGGVLVIYRDNQPFQGFTCTMVANGGPAAQGRPAMLWTQLQGMPPLRRVQVKMR